MSEACQCVLCIPTWVCSAGYSFCSILSFLLMKLYIRKCEILTTFKLFHNKLIKLKQIQDFKTRVIAELYLGMELTDHEVSSVLSRLLEIALVIAEKVFKYSFYQQCI